MIYRPARSLRLLLVVAALLSALVPPWPAVLAEPSLLHRQGVFRGMKIPPGASDVLLSPDGTRAFVSTTTFNRGRQKPETVVLGIGLRTSRVVWRRTLPSLSCCAFPVWAMTSAGDALAVAGAAARTVVYSPDGAPVFSAALTDSRLPGAVAIGDDGRLLVVGEQSRVAAFTPGRPAPLWVREKAGDILALTLAGGGEVIAAALRGEWLLLRARDGAVILRRPYGPARVAADVQLP